MNAESSYLLRIKGYSDLAIIERKFGLLLWSMPTLRVYWAKLNHLSLLQQHTTNTRFTQQASILNAATTTSYHTMIFRGDETAQIGLPEN